MGREVRRVPVGWQHPVEKDRLVPLFEGGCRSDQEQWDKDFAARKGSVWGFVEGEGSRPRVEDYMPEWEDSERTHFQMYENVSEGTPVSPVLATPEALAKWLVDNGAYAGGLGAGTASYDGWLRVSKGGYAPSAVRCGDGPLLSGVDGISRD